MDEPIPSSKTVATQDAHGLERGRERKAGREYTKLGGV